MSFTKFLKEGNVNERYRDSAEATDVMLDIQNKINDKNLTDWAKLTDKNFGTKSLSALTSAITA